MYNNNLGVSWNHSGVGRGGEFFRDNHSNHLCCDGDLCLIALGSEGCSLFLDTCGE